MYVQGLLKQECTNPGLLRFLQWSPIFPGSLACALCHAFGADSLELAVIFAENLCTFIIKVTLPRLYLCSMEAVLFFNQSPAERDNEELNKLLKLLSVKVSIA